MTKPSFDMYLGMTSEAEILQRIQEAADGDSANAGRETAPAANIRQHYTVLSAASLLAD